MVKISLDRDTAETSRQPSRTLLIRNKNSIGGETARRCLCPEKSYIAPLFGPEPVMLCIPSFRGRRGTNRMSGTAPVFIRQILPAFVLTAAGILVLTQISQPVSAPSLAAIGDTPVNAEAIFTSTPRPVAEEAKPEPAPRVVQKPKPAFPHATASRKPETALVQETVASAPLSITPSPEQLQTAAAPSDTGIMGTLRSVGTSVQQMPQRAYSSVTGWLSPGAPSQPNGPPRPPAEIPQNKAEM
jgi:hypothetical protein